MAHLHITSWALALILIVLVTLFYKQNKDRLGKIFHMILRVDYLLIIFSGAMLLKDYFVLSIDYNMIELVIKILAGVWVIISLEMISIKTSQKLTTTSWWIQLVIGALIAIGLGFARLPLGILP